MSNIQEQSAHKSEMNPLLYFLLFNFGLFVALYIIGVNYFIESFSKFFGLIMVFGIIIVIAGPAACRNKLDYLYVFLQIPIIIFCIAFGHIKPDSSFDSDLNKSLSDQLSDISIPTSNSKDLPAYIRKYSIPGKYKKVLILDGNITGPLVSHYHWYFDKRFLAESVEDAELIIYIEKKLVKHSSAEWVRVAPDGSRETISKVDIPKWDVYFWDRLNSTVYKKSFLGYLTRGSLITHNITKQKTIDQKIGTEPRDKLEAFFNIKPEGKYDYSLANVIKMAWKITVDFFVDLKSFVGERLM